MDKIEDGSYVLIVLGERKYLKRAKKGESFSGKGGKILYDDLIGEDFGLRKGEYLILRPTLEDVIMLGIKRQTQIVYPKDASYICMKLDIRDGSKILEVGGGSGALTLAFARACGPRGKVVRLERDERQYRNLKKNLEAFSELRNFEIILGDIKDYKGGEFDACFIDVREPWMHTRCVWELLRPSGIIGTIVPTANQISETLRSLQEGFSHVEVVEILLRKYKTIPERVRPVDRMVAHTGYLIFARKVKG